jgi:hypothetical protein
VLDELGADAVTVEKIRAAQPNLTPGDILPQWQIAQDQERDGYTSNARALLFGTLKKPRGRLYGRVGAAQLDPAAYADRDGFVLGSDTSAPEAETLHDRASRLVPPSPTDRYAGQDFVWMQGQLLMQDWSDEQAREALAQRRRRRGTP